MVVELVCVGTELLLGNIVNTNAAFLARQCAMLGLSMYHQSVVGDNEERLKETIRTALDRQQLETGSGSGRMHRHRQPQRNRTRHYHGKRWKVHDPAPRSAK